MITKDSKKILVADDSLFFRVTLADILVEAGHKVMFAGDGQEVMNEIKTGAEGIDLLTLDLQMPDVDGFAVLEWINEQGYRGKFPILVVTDVYEQSDVIGRLQGLGATGLMTKAFSPEQVLFRVNQMLFAEKWKYGKPRKRAPVTVPVDFTIDGFTRTGFLLNLSDTGGFLHTNVEYPVGTGVNLQFSLSGLHKVIDVKGTVLWVTHEKTEKGLFCGYGITFDSISVEDESILRTFVDAEIKRLGLYSDKTGG